MMVPGLSLLGYYASLLLFGAGAAAYTMVCLLLAWVPVTRASERFFQRGVHRLFEFFLEWARFIGLLEVRYRGFAGWPAGGLVVASNHPGLLDIVYLLAWIPEARCVFKPAIRRNPILGAIARRAGYLAGDGGHDLVRHAADVLAAGERLVIFPEGTRTPPDEVVGPCRPGFALMARRGRVPLQLVRLTWNSNVLVKGRAWWRKPHLPVRVELQAGPRLRLAADADPAEVARAVQRWFLETPEAAACQSWPAHVTVEAYPA